MSELTVHTCLERHLDLLVGVTPRTMDDYRSYIRRDMPPELLATPLTELSREDVTRWIQYLQARGLTPKSIRNKYVLLSAALNRAVADGYLPASPATDQTLPRAAPVTAQRFLTPEQFARLYAQISEHYQPLVEFLVVSGARWSEATALRPTDVNREAGTVFINKAWKYRPSTSSYTLGATKTNRSTRVINVAASTLDKLDYTGGFLFTTVRGKPVRGPNFHRHVWGPAVAEADLGFAPRIHDLRHTCASWMLAQGIGMYRVQAHLGHESIETTVRVYSHVDRRQAAQDADVMDTLIEDTLREG